MHSVGIQIALKEGSKVTLVVLMLYIGLSRFHSDVAQMELAWLLGIISPRSQSGTLVPTDMFALISATTIAEGLE